MTAKEYLSEVQRLQNTIVQTSSPTDRIGDMVGKIVELETGIQNDMVDIAYKRHEIINMIHRLDSAAHMQVLFGRYIQCRGLDAIGKDIGKSYRYVIEMHGKALKAFEELHKGILEKS